MFLLCGVKVVGVLRGYAAQLVCLGGVCAQSAAAWCRYDNSVVVSDLEIFEFQVCSTCCCEGVEFRLEGFKGGCQEVCV